MPRSRFVIVVGVPPNHARECRTGTTIFDGTTERVLFIRYEFLLEAESEFYRLHLVQRKANIGAKQRTKYIKEPGR